MHNIYYTVYKMHFSTTVEAMIEISPRTKYSKETVLVCFLEMCELSVNRC